MRSRLPFCAVVAAVLASAAPAIALQQVILPLPGGSNYQDPNSPNGPAQDQFSTDQSDSKTNSLGSFHFNVTSGSQWPGDAWRYRPQTSTPDAYGSASTPGSEFSNSGYIFPH